VFCLAIPIDEVSFERPLVIKPRPILIVIVFLGMFRVPKTDFDIAMVLHRGGRSHVGCAAPQRVTACVCVAVLMAVEVAGSASVCMVDEDCNLNGVCGIDGRCSCAPEWTGTTCGQLNLLPAKPRPYAGYDEDGNSSWGGSIVEHNGTWHMFAARMVGNCGLDTWQQNSEMVRAVATDPEGPYKYAETLMGVFSHGPKVRKMPGASGFMLIHLGCGTPIYPEIKTCHNGSTPAKPHNPHTPPNVCNQFNVSVTTASTPLGPWGPDHPVVLSTGNKPASSSWYVQGGRAFSNPSPHFLPNGTLLCGFRADARSGGERVSVASAPSIYGPYTDTRARPAVNTESHPEGQDEDPFLWQDERGHWHLLMHHLGGYKGVRDPVGAHAFSRDAIHWTKSAVLPYTTFVPFKDGSSINMTRRERPEMILSEKGQPRYFSSGVQEVHGDHSYTLVMQVASGRTSHRASDGAAMMY
jgi:hypothetical protein